MVGCMDDVCCVTQDLHCNKFSTVAQSLELTPPLPATAFSSYAIPMLATSSSVGATAPMPVHPPNHVLRMALLLLAILAASSTLQVAPVH